MELCRINLPVFLIYFNEKRCTNSRFDTIFNKTQFCYDKKIAAKSSGTQKRERAKNWWCFCSTSFRTAGVLGNKTSEKNSSFHIYETKVRFQTRFYPTNKLLVQCTKCSCKMKKVRYIKIWIQHWIKINLYSA